MFAHRLLNRLGVFAAVQVAGPVAATSQAAVHVAQAAQAVQQQAQSLHAAAEVHAQKAQEATSQVASLQATAHVSPGCCGVCLVMLHTSLLSAAVTAVLSRTPSSAAFREGRPVLASAGT
jgi:hypothetical protein